SWPSRTAAAAAAVPASSSGRSSGTSGPVDGRSSSPGAAAAAPPCPGRARAAIRDQNAPRPASSPGAGASVPGAPGAVPASGAHSIVISTASPPFPEKHETHQSLVVGRSPFPQGLGGGLPALGARRDQVQGALFPVGRYQRLMGLLVAGFRLEAGAAGRRSFLLPAGNNLV